jgi:hypothetical protein
MAAATVALTVVAAASGGTPAAPVVIRLYEKPLTEHFNDVGAKGLSAGDTDISTYALYKSPHAAKATGHSEAACTLIGPHAASCLTTIYLPNGKIIAGGAFHFRGNGHSERIAVLGGTGRYSGARGQITLLVRKQDIDVIQLLP